MPVNTVALGITYCVVPPTLIGVTTPVTSFKLSRHWNVGVTFLKYARSSSASPELSTVLEALHGNVKNSRLFKLSNQ
jgi:hypothetical protein